MQMKDTNYADAARGRMTGLLMGKSKHIKDGQMILFFFNDFALSKTDGNGKAPRD